jgi:phosphonate transport system substrate-binding protein
MKKNFLLFLVSILLIFLFTQCSKKEDDTEILTTSDTIEETKKTIVFGRVPADNVNVVLKQMTPLKNYLEETLDVNVVIRFAQNYDNVIQNLKENYDLALLGPAAYVEAHNLFGAIPLVKPIRYGKGTYTGIIITRTDSNIDSIDDLKDKKIAFVDPQSTSGYLFPLHLLNQHNLYLNKDFEHYFLNGHDNVVLNVLRRRYDAGACYDDARLVALQNNPSQIDELKIIGRTAPIANDPIVAGPNLVNDEQWFKKIQQAFLDLNEHSDKDEIFSSLTGGITGYEIAEDNEYSIIREVLER